MLDFLIVASGYNCKNNVHKCFNSIKNQTYQHFNAVLIGDGSTDGTHISLHKLKDANHKIKVEFYPHNVGAAKRRYDAIHKHANSKQTVVLLLGLDDILLPDALETIAEAYSKGCWMSYGNWINQNGIGLPEDFDLEFDEQTHASRNYRLVKYRSTAPNTFKKFLFDQIPEEDFKLDGKWIDTTTESELMFSCLEMCGKERIAVIKKPIYVYNEGLPGGTIKRLGSAYKRKVYSRIIARPKKNLFILAE